MANGADLSLARSTVVADFTAEDFDALSEEIERYARDKWADRWTDFHDDQFAVVFKDLLCYIGDKLSFNLNAKLRETFMATALRRQNILLAQQPFGVDHPEATAAEVDVVLTLNGAGTYPCIIDKTSTILSNGGAGDDEVFWYPTASRTITAPTPGNVTTMTFTEGTLFSDVIVAVADGSKSLRVQLPQQGILLKDLSVRVGSETWTRVSNFASAVSTSKVYRVLFSDTGDTFLLFGDGVFGAIPVASQNVYCTFSVGGGIRGSLAKETIRTVVSAHANVLSVTNPAASGGGKDTPTLAELRRLVPATLTTLHRVVNASDAKQLTESIDGVGKAFADLRPPGSRSYRVYVAPSGGGAPSAALLNRVVTGLKDLKMLAYRIRAYPPQYRSLRFEVLLHVNSSFRAGDVEQLARNAFLNTSQTGILNFPALGFAGLDASGKQLLSQTKFQQLFDSLRSQGLDRAEIVRLDVLPTPRIQDSGNTGNGTFGAVTLSGQQLRRFYEVAASTGGTYRVREFLVGFVSKLTDNSLTDETKVFQEEKIANYAGRFLYPDASATDYVLLTSATDQTLLTAGTKSLFSLTGAGTEYSVLVAETFVTYGQAFDNGQVNFTLSQGATPFLVGDSFYIDVFPRISDIRLRADEYPDLASANFVTRTSGGAQA